MNLLALLWGRPEAGHEPLQPTAGHPPTAHLCHNPEPCARVVAASGHVSPITIKFTDRWWERYRSDRKSCVNASPNGSLHGHLSSIEWWPQIYQLGLGKIISLLKIRYELSSASESLHLCCGLQPRVVVAHCATATANVTRVANSFS